MSEDKYVNVEVEFKQVVSLQYKVTSPTSHYREKILEDAVKKMKDNNGYMADSKVFIDIGSPFVPDDY